MQYILMIDSKLNNFIHIQILLVSYVPNMVLGAVIASNKQMILAFKNLAISWRGKLIIHTEYDHFNILYLKSFPHPKQS